MHELYCCIHCNSVGYDWCCLGILFYICGANCVHWSVTFDLVDLGCKDQNYGPAHMPLNGYTVEPVSSGHPFRKKNVILKIRCSLKKSLEEQTVLPVVKDHYLGCDRHLSNGLWWRVISHYKDGRSKQALLYGICSLWVQSISVTSSHAYQTSYYLLKVVVDLVVLTFCKCCGSAQ